MENNFGIPELKGTMIVDTRLNVVSYFITDIEEPITKKMLRKMKTILGFDYTLVTNAGVEIHSSEIKDDIWNGITIKRLNFKS